MTVMDAVARAIAEPTRRRILHIVRDRECTAGEIADNFDVSRPAISQHLKVLADAELVSVRQEGVRRYYRARPEGLRDLRGWMDGFWQTALLDLAAEVERDQAQPAREHPTDQHPTDQQPTDQQETESP